MYEERSRFLVTVRRIVHTAVAAGLSLIAAPLSQATPVATPRPLFEQIGALDRFPADARGLLGPKLVAPSYDRANLNHRTAGTALILPRARQLWQVHPASDGSQQTGIVVRDLDSLKIVHTFVFQDTFSRAAIEDSLVGDWMHAVDSDKRLWLLAFNHQFVYEFDLRSLGFKKRPLYGSLSPFPQSRIAWIVGGMTYDPFHDDLLLLYGGPGANSAANFNTFLYRLDVSGPPPAAYNPQDFERKMYRVRSCTAPVNSTDVGSDTAQWEVLATKEHVYIPCQRAGHTVIVVRTEWPEGGLTNTQHPEDVTAGPVYGDAVFADQASGRLFVTTYRREIWVFETSTMSFVGVVPAARGMTEHDRTGYGLDGETGRLFFQSPTFGLGVAEGRFFPIPQARTLPRFTTGQERILSDARTGRVFVLEGDSAAGTTTPRVAAYKIYRTDPAPVPPPPPDPDRNTADTAEREGVTEARYNGSASGYGSRALLAKGYATVVPAPTVGVLAPTTPLGETVLKNFCGYTDRDIFAGRVAKAEYDTGSTAAEAIAARIDDTTRQDLNQASRCTLPPAGSTPGAGWAYQPAACASNEGMDVPEVKAQGDNGGKPALGTASVLCPRPPGGRLTAEAESRLTGVVAVDRSWTKTAVERTASGLVSTVTAVAEGINIADTIFIAEVRSTATSSSNGRPRRNQMSIHDVSVRGVRVGTQDLCTAECNLQNLERDLNALAGGRIVFRTGKGVNSGLDQALLEGSPKGAQTAVQKSVARQASDRALVGDFTTEIPAFEMTVFNDNTYWGRARQIYQFAGVSSSATYNVVVRPSFVDPGLPPEAGGGGDLGTPELGGTPFDGAVEGLSGGGGVDFETRPAGRTLLRGDGDNDNPFVQALQAVARGLRLFLTSPRHALLLLTAWALLGSPAVLGRRRRLLRGVEAD